MRLFIVSGPYEGERIRRAAVAIGLDVEALESAELPATKPGDGVLVAINRADDSPRATLASLRGRLGEGVPLFVLGEPLAASEAAGLATTFFTRPLSVEDLVANIRAQLLQPQPARRPSAPSPPPAARRAPAGRGGQPLFEGFLEGIDQALDRDLMDAAHTVISPAPTTQAAQAAEEWNPRAQPTQKAPRALVESMLANSEAKEAASASGPSPRPPITGEPTRAGPGDGVHAATRDEPAQATVVEQEVDLALLLGRSFIETFTGRVRLRRGPIEKSMFFEGGRPVLAASNAVEDRMIEMFLRQGRLTREQHQEAVRTANRTGRRMGTILIELGIMKSEELLPAVREHYEELVYSLFTWDRASLRIEPGAVLDPRRIRLVRHPIALVHEGVRRAYGRDRLLARVGARRNVLRFDGRPGVTELVNEAGLGSDERRVLALFDGARSLDDVVNAAGVPDDVVYRTAAVFIAFGALVRTGGGSGAFPAAPSQPGGARGLRERLLARYAVAREGDYFQVLGLLASANSSAEDVRRAHARILEELDPDAVGSEIGGELATEISEIREAADEAMRILSSDDLGARYRAGLPRATAAASENATPDGQGSASQPR